jgi:hypothetical protein
MRISVHPTYLPTLLRISPHFSRGLDLITVCGICRERPTSSLKFRVCHKVALHIDEAPPDLETNSNIYKEGIVMLKNHGMISQGYLSF